MSDWGIAGGVLGGMQQGLQVGNQIFGAGERRRQQQMQEQRQIMGLQNDYAAMQEAQALREHNAALRPMQLKEAERKARTQELQDLYHLANFEIGENGEMSPETFGVISNAMQGLYGKQIDNDGSGKTIAGFIPYNKSETPAYGLMLNTPKSAQSLSPLTARRTGDPDDEVRWFTPDTFKAMKDEHGSMLNDVLAGLPADVELSPELQAWKAKRNDKAILSALAQAAGVTQEKEESQWGQPVEYGDEYVVFDQNGKPMRVASNYRVALGKEGIASKERIAQLRLQQAREHIQGMIKRGEVKHLSDPQKMFQTYFGIVSRQDIADENGFPRKPTVEEAKSIAIQLVQDGQALFGGGGTPALNPSPVPAPKPKSSAAYQEYLEAFNATKDPKKREAITNRARQNGVVK